jgi:siroheme synthase
LWAGDPQLITVKGKRCLEAADVILYDDLVNRDLTHCAAKNAELIYVGKKPGAYHVGQEETGSEVWVA